VPTEKVVEVRRGRKVDAERKFFPGYVLVKMDMTDQAYHLIKNTPKVTGFLGADNKPMPISEAEAMRILQQVQEGVERPKPSISSRSASRCASPTGRSPRSTASSRKSTRNALARQGRGVDLRPPDAGRTGIRSGREGLTATSAPAGETPYRSGRMGVRQRSPVGRSSGRLCRRPRGGEPNHATRPSPDQGRHVP
jgi:hypothetical protein